MTIFSDVIQKYTLMYEILYVSYKEAKIFVISCNIRSHTILIRKIVILYTSYKKTSLVGEIKHYADTQASATNST